MQICYDMHHNKAVKELPDGPVAKTPHTIQGAWGLITSQGTRFPHPQIKNPHATRRTEGPVYCNQDSVQPNKQT